MKIYDPSNQLITSKIRMFDDQIYKLKEIWDQCSIELDLLNDDSVPFSVSRLNRITQQMSAISIEISRLNDIKKRFMYIISN